MRYHIATSLLILLLASYLGATSLSAEEGEPSPVTGLTLIDAETHTPIRALIAGETINLADLSTRKLNIRAETKDSVSRVDFQYDLQRRFRSETSAPFSLAGDSAGKYRAWTPTLGSHQITAIPYSGNNKETAFSLTFQVIDEELDKRSDEKIRAKTDETPPAVVHTTEIPTPVAPNVQPQAVSTKKAATQTEAPPSSSVFLLEQPRADSRKAGTKSALANTAAAPPPTGKCVSFVDDQATRLTLGCSYTLSDPVRAHVALDLGNSKTRAVCDLGMPATPMVASCALTPEIAAGLGEGKLVLSIESLAETGSSLQGRLGPLAVNSAAAKNLTDLHNGGLNN